MNDPEFKVYLNAMMTIREGGPIKCKKYGKKSEELTQEVYNLIIFKNFKNLLKKFVIFM